MLDFGLAQIAEADTLTAVGDVPGTLAYISPSGSPAARRAGADVWAVGVILWEALAGSIRSGASLSGRRVHDRRGCAAAVRAARRPAAALISAVDAALSVDPAKRPPAARLAADLRDALTAAPDTRPPSRAETKRVRPAKRPRPASPPVPLAPRLVPAGAAAFATLVGGSLLPFWPTSLLVVLALAAGLASLRAPRLGLVIALAAPVFPLGNVAQAAAVVYGALALGWLAVTWRDARAGLVFLAGPLLATFGLIALLPLAVQPARAVWRRALHAAVGVYAAAAVAGLSGRDLPLGAGVVHDLGVAQSERPSDVVHALGDVLRPTRRSRRPRSPSRSSPRSSRGRAPEGASGSPPSARRSSRSCCSGLRRSRGRRSCSAHCCCAACWPRSPFCAGSREGGS